MLSYDGFLKDCFYEASQDERFNYHERKVLEKLAKYLLTEENGDRIITEGFGTGRIYSITESKIRFLVHDSTTGYNIGVIEDSVPKMTKAMGMLSNLKKDEIIRHKKEQDFYIETYEENFILWRNGSPTVGSIEYMETVIKHHDTRNWETIQSDFTERHPILSI